MSTTAGSGSLRERLKAEADTQTREIMEIVVRRITSEAEAGIRNAVEQAVSDLSHQAERMERVAKRLTWVRAATVALAMAAGALGGAVAAWMVR